MMNTNFAQILVSGLKMSSNRFKVGMLSLIFTFVFLGMGTNSHAQSLQASNAKIDVSVLDGYSFKTSASVVKDVLRPVLANTNATGPNELANNLKKHFISSIITNVNNNNGNVRQAVHSAYFELVSFSRNFNNPDAKVVEVVQEVSALIN